MSAIADEQRTLLDELREKRSTLLDEAKPLIEARETERAAFEAREANDKEQPSEEERSAFNDAEAQFKADLGKRKLRIEQLSARIDEQELEELRKSEAARASKPSVNVRVTSEPLTYRSDNAQSTSYYRDLAIVSKPGAAASFRSTTVEDARERLFSHGREMDVEMPKRAAVREARAQKQVDEAEREFTGSFVNGQRRGLNTSPFERRVNPNRTDGQGGYFVPPLWLIDEYIPLLRAGRVAANLCRNLDLPPGTDSINIPKLATGTATAIQTADNSAVQSTDFTDTSVQANVKTVAGQQDVAIQLLDQSPGQIIDQVVTEDLMGDFNRLIDRQVVSGNGTNSATLNGGQVLGIYPSTNWSGTNVITWTETAPANGQHFIQVLGAMASQASYSRYNLQNFNFLMHPRRWFWYATTLDSGGRPIVEAAPGVGMNLMGFNPAASEVGQAPAEGVAGQVAFGPKAYISGNVPVTDTTGGGTGQDIAIGAKWDDLWLFESEPRTRVLEEVLSGTLEIRFQVYGYIAFLARYGQSISIAEGSGFAAPTGIDTSVVF
jgi:HK97 family phage major capsid protein